MFNNLRNLFTDHNWLRTLAILAPKNVAVDLNIKLLEGKCCSYNSIHALLNADEAVNYLVQVAAILGETEFCN